MEEPYTSATLPVRSRETRRLVDLLDTIILPTFITVIPRDLFPELQMWADLSGAINSILLIIRSVFGTSVSIRYCRG